MSFSIQKDLLKNLLERDNRSVISFKKGGVFSTEYMRSEKSPYKIDNNLNKVFKTLTSTSLPVLNTDFYNNSSIAIEKLKLTTETLQSTSDIDSFLNNGVSKVNIVLKKALRQLSIDIDSLYNTLNKVNVILTAIDIYNNSENIVQEVLSIKVVLEVLFNSLKYEYKDTIQTVPKSLQVDSRVFSNKVITFFNKGDNRTRDKWVDTKNADEVYSKLTEKGYEFDKNFSYLDNNLYNVRDDQFTVEIFLTTESFGEVLKITNSIIVEVKVNKVLIKLNNQVFEKSFSRINSIAISRDSSKNVYIFVNKILQKTYNDDTIMYDESNTLKIGGESFKGLVSRFLFIKGECLYKDSYSNSYEPEKLLYKSEVFAEEGDCIVKEKSDFPNNWVESNVHVDGNGFTNKSTHGFVKTDQYETWIDSRGDFDLDLDFLTGSSLKDEVYLVDVGFGCLQIFTDSRDPTVLRLRINNSEDPIVIIKTKPNLLQKNSAYKVNVVRNTTSLRLIVNDILIDDFYFTGKISSKSSVILLNNHAQNTGFNGTLNRFSFLTR